MIKSQVKVSTTKKEYDDLTFEQVKQMVVYMNQGLSEEEAIAKVKGNA